MKSFASDNYATIHPKILNAIAAANTDHAVAYGADPWTLQLDEKIKSIFGPDATAFPVFNGTGANIVGLQSLLRSYEAVLCSSSAHIQMDECGAAEFYLGCKLIDVPAPDGKLRPEDLKPYTENYGNEHQVQARVLSLTQSTERGTLYTLAELKELSTFARTHKIRVAMDGARFANAVAALGESPRNIVEAAGVEVLSLGGTKNGLMLGELVVVFNPELAATLKFYRKQAMQLASKMRFISAQFNAYFEDNLWIKNAAHANSMAKLLAEQLRDIPNVQLSAKVEVNALFVTVPRTIIAPLQAEYPFYVWDESKSELRWMCSFDTTEADVQGFVKKIKALC